MRPRVSTEKPVPAVGTRDPETNNTAGRPWRRLSALPSRRQSDPDPDPDPVRPRRPGPCCAGKCSLWWLHVLSLALHGSGWSLPSPRPSEPRLSPVRRRGGHRQAGAPPPPSVLAPSCCRGPLVSLRLSVDLPNVPAPALPCCVRHPKSHGPLPPAMGSLALAVGVPRSLGP